MLPIDLMARPLRIEYPGAIYHVTVRGNARQIIFRDDRDRYLLQARLAESVDTYGVRLFVFCLMDNHLHLVLETPRANLSRFMQSLLTGYTVVFNLRHRQPGHVTQGRFHARLVQGDEYLLKLTRYVHLNPVQKEPCASKPLGERIDLLRTYPWSSYLGYVVGSKRADWVVYEPMLALIGGRKKHQAERYRQFVETGLAEGDEEFQAVMRQSPRCIGDEAFREWVNEQHDALLSGRRRSDDVSFREVSGAPVKAEAVLEAVAKAAGLPVAELGRHTRNCLWKGIAARLLIKHAELTRRECAQLLGLTASSGVSYQMKKAEEAIASDAQLACEVNALEARLAAQARR
ncbi:MAG: hypothetical protein GX608_01950 [Lentisphaerae bacterium]|nr:hypothetical protein [Lentisphaerota bacterium]